MYSAIRDLISARMALINAGSTIYIFRPDGSGDQAGRSCQRDLTWRNIEFLKHCNSFGNGGGEDNGSSFSFLSHRVCDGNMGFHEDCL